jgi:hypothetical protein
MSGTTPPDVRNERAKLLATAFNNLGVGAILAGIIVPSANGSVADITHIAVWLIAGADLIWLAQIWLGRLR